MSSIIVNKLGGEIMSARDTLELALVHAQDQIRQGEQPVFVVSAIAGMTDRLIQAAREVNEVDTAVFCKEVLATHEQLAQEVLRDPQGALVNLREIGKRLQENLDILRAYGQMSPVVDQVISFGEELSSEILIHLLKEGGVQAEKMIGSKSGIITDEHFGSARILYEKTKPRLQEVFKEFWAKCLSCVPVVTGFCGASENGHTTLLGRGGTDTTACVVAAALAAKEVILWKTVPGVLSADPKVIPESIMVPCVTYKEAEESGKVLCSEAIQYIEGERVNARVASIFAKEKSTQIAASCPANGKVKIISSKENLVFLSISSPEVEQYGFLNRVASVFAEEQVNMVLIRNTRDTLYIVIEDEKEKAENALGKLQNMGYHMETFPCAMVTIIGDLNWEIASKVNAILQELGGGETPMGVFPYKNSIRFEAVVRPERLQSAIQAFHDELIK